MDFPVFFLPYLGNRMLIAIIGVIHIMISHGCAIGGSLMFVLMEYKGLAENNDAWTATAKKMTRLILIITTSLGALTGVGIWLSTATVSPYGIGSLLRIFFWVWFFEWIVFVIELLLILGYYLSWDRVSRKTHFRIGIAYVIASYVTMIMIVGILGAMLTPDAWLTTRSLIDGFFNSSYLPQLLARMFIAPLLGSAFVLFFFCFFKTDPSFRAAFNSFFGKALILCSGLFLPATLYYYHRLPDYALSIAPIALTTKALTTYLRLSLYLIPAISVVLVMIGLLLQVKSGKYRSLAILPVLLMVLVVAQFERVREFIRKPFIIYNYLYTNGIRVDEIDYYHTKGILPSIFLTGNQSLTDMNDLEKGDLIFRVECANCHTYNGINSIFDKTSVWDEKTIYNFIGTYKRSHPYMPPFAGTDQERSYLSKFIAGKKQP